MYVQNSSQIGFFSPAGLSLVMSTQFAANTTGEIFYGSGPVYMISGQVIAPGQLTDPGSTFLGARSGACNCSHEFVVAPGQLREASYTLYNTG